LLFDEWNEVFIRNGATSTVVTAWLDNGLCLSREKGPAVNKITVTTPDNKTQVYEKFGPDMPLEIKKLIGIFPARIDSDYSFNLNLAGQDDGAFLLTESPLSKTKFLNRLTGAHIVDSALRTVNKEKSDLASTKNKCIEDLKQTNKELEKYKNLDVISDRIQQSLTLVKDIDRWEGIYNTLTELRSGIIKVAQRLEKIASFQASYSPLEQQFINLQRYSGIISQLFGIQHSLHDIKTDHAQVVKDLEDVYQQQAVLLKDNMCPLCGTILKTGQILQW
jgi:exonuclease SbcC